MKRGTEDDTDNDASMPCKKHYRQRAHCNPLSNNDGFEYPMQPDDMDWSPYFPGLKDPRVDFLDIGCGFGGLTVALATLFPDQLTLGMEIRPKVCEFVKLKCEALRKENPGSYENASALRTNAMRYLPNFFKKQQLSKLFFCFPDPHFKAKNHRRRIISETLLTEYAHFLKPDGRLYTITDVEDLHNWHVEKCDGHPLFERLDDDEVLNDDPAVRAIMEETEEGKKVARNGGSKFYAVYRRIREDEFPQPTISEVL